MDSVRNEERAWCAERASWSAGQKHRRSYRAPRRPAPRPTGRTRLIDAGASRRQANLTSTAGGRELPRRARSNVENALHRRRSLYNTTRF